MQRSGQGNVGLTNTWNKNGDNTNIIARKQNKKKDIINAHRILRTI